MSAIELPVVQPLRAMTSRTSAEMSGLQRRAGRALGVWRVERGALKRAVGHAMSGLRGRTSIYVRWVGGAALACATHPLRRRTARDSTSRWRWCADVRSRRTQHRLARHWLIVIGMNVSIVTMILQLGSFIFAAEKSLCANKAP